MSFVPTQTRALGETNLTTLLSTLQATLHPETFVFVTFPPHASTPPTSLDIQMSFRELEGQTIITTQSSAISHNLEHTFPCRMVTLNVHSSLEAVGFIAAISAKLTEANIGVNPVSGFFHDHCFIPAGKEERVLQILRDIALEAKRTLGD